VTDWKQVLLRRLRAKRQGLAMAAPSTAPQTVAARVRAEGCSGIRSIHIRGFQLLSDADSGCAGFHVGPTAPELQLGALGSSLTDTFLSQAAVRGVPLDDVEVEITGTLDASCSPQEEPARVCPHDIRYTVHLRSPAPAEQIAALHAAVERACPLLNLLIQPQAIQGQIVHELGPTPGLTSSPN
jgi:uncharacterized OsmC-like protein